MQLQDKPRSYQVSALTHATAPGIESKFRFFADCLDLINLKAGEYYYFETETHLSLIKSLQYSIETAHQNFEIKHAKNVAKQLKYILRTHPLLKPNDRIVLKFYPNSSIIITDILNQSGNDKADLIQIDDNLKTLLKIFSESYLDNLVSEIVLYIGCNHKLQYHKKDLDYCAKIVFSYFYLNDYSRRDISSFVSRLLDCEVEKYDDKIYTQALLPNDLRKRLVTHNKSTEPFNENLFNEIKTFFELRSTKDQIEGFFNLANREKTEHTFLFKIDGSWISENEMTLHGLNFIDTKHFREMYNVSLKDNDINSFLNTPSVLLEYKAYAYSDSEALKLALSEVKEKLDRIGFILDKNFNLNTFGYIVRIDDKRLWLNEISERFSLTDWDLKAVEQRDTPIQKQEFKNFLLSKEKILTEAYGEENLGKSLHDYSKFVEQLTLNNLTGIDSLGGVQNKILAIAYLLLLAELESFKQKIRRWGYNVIINSASYPIIGEEIKDKLHGFRGRKILPSLSEIKTEFNHPHTNYRIKTAYDSKNNVPKVEAFHYYVRFLLMLNRYRNIQEHMSINEKQYARKLKLSINVLLLRVFGFISKELSKPSNSGLTAELVVKNLILEGKAKFDELNIVL